MTRSSPETTAVLRLLQASSCFRGEVCASLPCACAESLAALPNVAQAPLRAALEDIPCNVCGGSGFSGHGTGYDDVCGECGGLKYFPRGVAQRPSSVCCYCDAALSCAACGAEQPDDILALSRDLVGGKQEPVAPGPSEGHSVNKPEPTSEDAEMLSEMSVQIWAAGASLEDAAFIARMLWRNGFSITKREAPEFGRKSP